ncbi:voltage-gated potassium channel subunit beta-2-like isoform X1 [Pieris napi]|uniref:voltage-gated potassium channel subunit beta-2-like isoform X1 n=2 Tax=Pieris napi TaxID=78633 RepID=UPI001FB9BF34|nr:voltage-gated potassium channel subunit beta-2-like isoform X1 [Pieris napi]
MKDDLYALGVTCIQLIQYWWSLEDRPYWWVQETNYYIGSERPKLLQTSQTCETGPGNPSGHTATAASVLVLAIMWISHIFNDRKWKTSLWKYAVYPLFGSLLISVMLARMYIGTHFPHQCIVGGMIASWENMARQSSVYIGNHTSIPSSVTPGLLYKNLGKSGLLVPNIGLSLWTMLNEDVAEDLVMTALESGINLIDLSKAHNAQGEAELGRILKKRNVKRSSIIITTKIYWSTKCEERGQSRKHIIESVKESLGRLQLEYIDLVLVHKVDPLCPMEELVRTMNGLINEGFVMYWGTARWTPTEIMDAYSKCRTFNCWTPVVEQTEYHMFCREKTELYMPDVYRMIGVGTMAWSALSTDMGLNREGVAEIFAKSRFNRKYSTFSWWEEELVANNELENNESAVAEQSRSFKDKLKALSDLANALNCSIRQLSLAWCLKNENINCLLLGATSVEQFKENIHALQIVPQLSPEVILDIEKILANKPQRPPMIARLDAA